MNQSPQLPNPARIVRILHGALLAGVIMAAGAFALVVYVRHAPLLAGAATLGLVLAAVGVVLLVVAAAVLRPRMPERRSDQSADDYWVSVESRSAAIVLWAVAEAAALVSLVGYVLTGASSPAAAAALAIVALFVFRPGRLEAD